MKRFDKVVVLVLSYGLLFFNDGFGQALLFQKSDLVPSGGYSSRILATPDSGFLVSINSTLNSHRTWYVYKYDKSNILEWEKIYKYNFTGLISYILNTNAGYLIVGLGFANNSYAFQIIQLDFTGDTIFTKSYIPNLIDNPGTISGVWQDSSNIYITAVYRDAFPSLKSHWVIMKLDSLGNLLNTVEHHFNSAIVGVPSTNNIC